MLIPDFIFIGTIVFLIVFLLLIFFAESFNLSFHPKLGLYAIISLFTLGISFTFCDVVYISKDNTHFTQYYSWGGFKEGESRGAHEITGTHNYVIFDFLEEIVDE